MNVLAGAELADVRLDVLASGQPNDQFGIGAAGQCGVHRRWERAPEAGVHVGDPEADADVAECLDRAGSAHAERLDNPAAEIDQARGLRSPFP